MIYRRAVDFFFTAIIFCALLQNCSHKWTEKERAEFANQCQKTDSVSNLIFEITGFERSAIEHVLVRQLHDNIRVDSFFVKANGLVDSSMKTYSGSVNRSIPVHDSYEFVIAENKFLLSRMEMKMAPQYSMAGEGWGCVMNDYFIDTVHFENSATPRFVRK